MYVDYIGVIMLISLLEIVIKPLKKVRHKGNFKCIDTLKIYMECIQNPKIVGLHFRELELMT